jgi:hypothetical protein
MKIRVNNVNPVTSEGHPMTTEEKAHITYCMMTPTFAVIIPDERVRHVVLDTDAANIATGVRDTDPTPGS